MSKNASFTAPIDYTRLEHLACGRLYGRCKNKIYKCSNGKVRISLQGQKRKHQFRANSKIRQSCYINTAVVSEQSVAVAPLLPSRSHRIEANAAVGQENIDTQQSLMIFAYCGGTSARSRFSCDFRAPKRGPANGLRRRKHRPSRVPESSHQK